MFNLHLLTLVTVIAGVISTISGTDDCTCEFGGGNFSIHDTVQETERVQYRCCFKDFGVDPSSSSVSWSFPVREENTSVVKKRRESCDGQLYTIKKVEVADGGFHTCVVTTEDGGSRSRTINLTVNDDDRHGAWLDSTISEDVYANVGDTKTFRCKYYVKIGKEAEVDIYWLQLRSPEEQLFIKDVTDANESRSINRTAGTCFTNLTLYNITEEHFKTYNCVLVMDEEKYYENVTLIRGESPSEQEIRKWFVLIYITVGMVTIVSLSACFVYKFQLDIVLLYRKKSRYWIKEEDLEKRFVYDIFIIHGPSTNHWVRTSLLDVLEDDWSYKCYVINRDMMGGEDYLEEIISNIDKSRRIVIVLSTCLLANEWGQKMMLEGIHKAAISSARIFAIKLPEVFKKAENSTLETRNVLEVFQFIKMIPCPLNISQDEENFKQVVKGETSIDIESPLLNWKNGAISRSLSSNYISTATYTPKKISLTKDKKYKSLTLLNYDDVNHHRVIPISLLDDSELTEEVNEPMLNQQQNLPQSKSDELLQSSAEDNDKNIFLRMVGKLYEKPEKIFWKKLRIRLPRIPILKIQMK